MFSCTTWDGLAKIGKYEVNQKTMITPALFPVVDPYQQDIKVNQIQSKFGFNQVITSAYLMTKRTDLGKNWEAYPNVHDYLDFNGIVAMDSGAFQLMQYGDIDLGIIDTLELQKAVKTDIGVIMDHPIGYDVSYKEAETRIETTFANVEHSIELFDETNINWMLPIQGGKYIDLMRRFIINISKPQIIDQFSMYALGSVVPVMINQDYTTLVKMIATARYYLPVTYPLHLFGAGHPVMFALATFLGCDSFDSAAYSLMAKDDRYMTVEGTYNLTDLDEFPCSCPICVNYSPREIKNQTKDERRKNIAEHNLWVSAAEIRRIRHAIKIGRLWDLVQQRANSVPKLARATRLAIDYVSSGKLNELYKAGIPISNNTSIRISRVTDINKVNFKRTRDICDAILNKIKPQNLIMIAYSMKESIYRKLQTDQLKIIQSNPAEIVISLLLPPFGIVPFELKEFYPIGQLVHDLEIDDFDVSIIINQLNKLKEYGLSQLKIILPYSWPKSYFQNIETIIPNTTIIYTKKPFITLKHEDILKLE